MTNARRHPTMWERFCCSVSISVLDTSTLVCTTAYWPLYNSVCLAVVAIHPFDDVLQTCTILTVQNASKCFWKTRQFVLTIFWRVWFRFLPVDTVYRAIREACVCRQSYRRRCHRRIRVGPVPERNRAHLESSRL